MAVVSLFYFLLCKKQPNREDGGITTAVMNIAKRALLSTHENGVICCPGCHSTHCYRHGSYIRKGFHSFCRVIGGFTAVPRYRCINSSCRICTFSVLPPMVIRYCRFLWPCLTFLWGKIDSGATPYALSRQWSVGRAVIVRARALQASIEQWTGRLYQELTMPRTHSPLSFV